MKCSPSYANLPCSKLGAGYTRFRNGIGSDKLFLRLNHGDAFPDLAEGEYFYAHIVSPCNKHCTRVKVIRSEGDSLTLESGLTACFNELSRVSYILDAQAVAEIAAQVGVNVVEPLIYDCSTNTLSIDCQKLRQMLAKCGG